MLIKSFEEQTISGVLLANGRVSYQSVKLNVHAFYVDGVLIDTGSKSLEEFFTPFFRELDIDQVVLTHYHEDHSGGASFLLEELERPVFMSDILLESCTQPADYLPYRQLFWGKREPFRAQPIAESFESRHATWKAIPTPGHSADHLAFLNEQTGQLFTGDLYCQPKTKVLLREESVTDTIQSLNTLLTHDFGEVYCNHAGYLEQGRAALTAKLEFLQELQAQILRLHQEGNTPQEINASLFPRKYPIIDLSQGEWDSMHIITSVIQQSQTVN